MLEDRDRGRRRRRCRRSSRSRRRARARPAPAPSRLPPNESIDGVHALAAGRRAHLLRPLRIVVAEAALGPRARRSGRSWRRCPTSPRPRAPSACAICRQHVETPEPPPVISSRRPGAAPAHVTTSRATPSARPAGRPRPPPSSSAAGLGMDVDRGHDHLLRERALRRRAEDVERRGGRVLLVAPGERRVDHDLVARRDPLDAGRRRPRCGPRRRSRASRAPAWRTPARSTSRGG